MNLHTLDKSAFYTGFSFFFLDPYIQITGVALGASVLEIGSFCHRCMVSGLLYTAGWDKLVITSATVQAISLLALVLLWKTYVPYDVLREKPVITVITPQE